MNIEIGQRVRLRHTGNEGNICGVMPGGMVLVRLDDGLGEVPMPASTLDPIVEAKPAKERPAPTPPPKQQSTPKEEPAEPPRYRASAPAPLLDEIDDAPDAAPPADTGHHWNPTSAGFQLAFDPVQDAEGNTEAYTIYLINATPHRTVFNITCTLKGSRKWEKMGQLPAAEKKKLEWVPYDWLNERLAFDLDVRTLKTTGTGPRHFKSLVIKGKQFFAKFQDVPELYREAHLYTVFPTLDSTDIASAPAAAPSLKAITQQHLASRPKPKADAAVPVRQLTQTDLDARKEFDETLDLHLANLVNNPSAVPKHQVLQTQLRHFEEYLEKALRLGVDRIFVIHGVGQGKLKNEIHKRLRRTPFVKKYKNEYHHKYGYGATEVIFD